MRIWVYTYLLLLGHIIFYYLSRHVRGYQPPAHISSSHDICRDLSIIVGWQFLWKFKLCGDVDSPNRNWIRYFVGVLTSFGFGGLERAFRIGLGFLRRWLNIFWCGIDVPLHVGSFLMDFVTPLSSC